MHRFLFNLGCLFLCSTVHANLSIEGTYQGTNLYIQNPENSEGYGFCVYKVTINDSIELNPDSLRAAAFEIKLRSYGFEIGDPLFIVLFHHEGCKPKILNPNPHGYLSKIEFSSLEILAGGIVAWSTTKNDYKSDFTVQIYRWNKWIDLGSVPKTGNSASYTFPFKPHAGENQLRLKLIKNETTAYTSKVIQWISDAPKLKIDKIDSESKKIILSDSSLFELFDRHGNIVLKGTRKEIDCSELPSTEFYLNFDNQTQFIDFKKPKRKKP